MDFNSYTRLTTDEKAAILWENGRYVDCYMSQEMMTNLYQLGDYYVEVILTAGTASISEITPFKKGARLDKYLESVDLNHLFKNA